MPKNIQGKASGERKVAAPPPAKLSPLAKKEAAGGGEASNRQQPARRKKRLTKTRPRERSTPRLAKMAGETSSEEDGGGGSAAAGGRGAAASSDSGVDVGVVGRAAVVRSGSPGKQRRQERSASPRRAKQVKNATQFMGKV